MQRLNSAIAAAVSPAAYDVGSTGVGIVHIGPGAFHRAHQAVFTEDALAYGGDWRICGVQMRSSGIRDALQPQDYRYTLAVLDEVRSTRVIHAVHEILVASEDIDRVLDRLVSRSTHIVTLTVTEKGYCLTATGQLDRDRPEIIADLVNTVAPQSVIGLLTEALRRRRNAGYADVTVVSCDNLSDNGRLLAAAVRDFAAINDPELAAWIVREVAFPCTMVDSITPATDDALRQYVSDRTGYEDRMPVSREAFSQWVIEDRFTGPRPAWDKVGVVFTDDVALFETAKIRLLNGAHSTLAYAGLLLGYSTVLEAIRDAELSAFVRHMMLEEICPTLKESAGLDLVAYTDEILQRFRNPEIAYRLTQIAWDGSQKVRFRLFATLADNLAAGRASPRLVYAVAAWLHFIRRCERHATPMTDPIRDELLAVARRSNGAGGHDVGLFLEMPGLFPAALAQDDAFRAQLVNAYAHIEGGGSHVNLLIEQ